MEKLLRPDGEGRLITHGHYLRKQRPEILKGKTSETASKPAVHLNITEGIKIIGIWSQHLIEALNKVNKHPSLRKESGTYIELYEPFQLLYDHLEDMGKEISRLNLSEADEDFKALECATSEVASRWDTARAENQDSEFVQFDTLWRLFYAGDIVVHKDDLGSEWLLTLIDVEEKWRHRPRKYGFNESQTMERYMGLRTWSLVWNGDENKLERKIAMFRIPQFLGVREIQLLPVYPVRYRQGPEPIPEFLQRLTARGRVWFQRIATRISYLEYDGLAFNRTLISSTGAREHKSPKKLKVSHRKDKSLRAILCEHVLRHKQYSSKRVESWSALGQSKKQPPFGTTYSSSNVAWG
jgi:hypothetical protein